MGVLTKGLIVDKVIVVSVLVAGLVFGVSSIASAHVTVKPAEAVTAGFQTFTVGVPNEKDQPTTKVKLLIPEGLEHVSPTQKPGWSISIEKSGEGEKAVVTAITWSEGTVSVGMRDEFTFSAKVPGKASELRWKAYQTYADGTLVSWDKEDEGGHSGGVNSGPFSVTKVALETAQAEAIRKAETAAADARSAASRAFSLAATALAVGFVGIFLVTRQRK